MEPEVIEAIEALMASSSSRFYTGIGSRQTPLHWCELATLIAQYLDVRGYTLRSGGADGADLAFEAGSTRKEIFLPWRGFNGSKSELFDIPDEAFEVSVSVAPHLKYVQPPVKRLMARNVQQVLGQNLDSPSAFVMCWTQDSANGRSIPTGKRTGGTGQAIRIAAKYGVPVLNLMSLHPYQDYSLMRD